MAKSGDTVAVVIGPGQSGESTSIVRYNDLAPCRESAVLGWPNADPSNLASGGSIWPPVLEYLYTRYGVRGALFNFAVGSTGIIFNWSGYLATYAAAATFTAGRYVKVGSNIYKANGAAGTQFVADASTPPAWGNTLSAVYNEASGGGSWTCVEVGTSDATGKLYAPGDALFDPLGLVAAERAKIISLASRFTEVWAWIQIGQGDAGLPQATFEQAHKNIIDYWLSAAANVRVQVGVTFRRWDGASPGLWDTFYQPAIANVLASYAGNPRVAAGGNCSGTTSAMMLPENSGTLLIHPNNLGKKQVGVPQWCAAIDASGFVS